jgi:ABC-2 type transport system permease protein
MSTTASADPISSTTAAVDPAASYTAIAHAPAGIGAAWMLARREWIRFFRQRNRVISAVVQPLLFWLLFGTGLRGSFVGAGDQYCLPRFFQPYQ